MSGTSEITGGYSNEAGHKIDNSASRIFSQAIFLDANVVAGLAAVTDESLRTATVGAALLGTTDAQLQAAVEFEAQQLLL